MVDREQLDSRLNSGKEFLQSEVLKWVQARRPSRRGLVSALTKWEPASDRRPEWMDEPEFDGEAWIELNVATRKFILRHAVTELLVNGLLKFAVHKRSRGDKYRLEVETVLDVLSHL